MPRVILYKGTFAYDAVNIFVEELAAGLAALGREVVLLDLSDRSGRSAKIQEELTRPFECIVAFAGIGFRPMSVAAGTHIYDSLSAPLVAVLVDHPSCQLDRFGTDNMIITCYDRSHVAFLNRYFDGRKRVEFLPHGGSVAADGGAEPGGRSIDLLFPGDREILLSRWTQLEQMPGRLAAVLDDEAELRERSSAGLEAGKAHTWAAREPYDASVRPQREFATSCKPRGGPSPRTCGILSRIG